MIKVKLKQIVNSTEILEKLATQEINGITSYKISKIIQLISKEMQLFTEARQKLLDKYCVKDENNNIKIDDNGNVQIQLDCINDYNIEIEKLVNTEVELNIILLLVEDFQNIKISPGDIIQIDWLIK